MGVSGVGKSTVGSKLAAALGVPFVDGDDLHPPANKAKMAAGHPLSDEDRWPWLDAVEAWIDADAAACCGGVVACSALKRSYRDRLRRGGANVWFLHLDAPHDVVERRMRERRGHQMPVSLLDSQEAALEPLHARRGRRHGAGDPQGRPHREGRGGDARARPDLRGSVGPRVASARFAGDETRG